MTTHYLFRVLAILMLSIGMVFGAHAATIIFPDLSGRIVDQAHILSSQNAAALDQKLSEFETQTGHQIVVVTLNDIGDNEIADYGYQLGRHWQIGQAGKNDGVIILLVPSTRQVRIEVGYGLEGDLTDATSSLIINNIMIPSFKNGDIEGGLVQGTLAVMSVVSGDGQAVIKAAGKQQDDWLTTLLILFLIVWMLSRLNKGQSSTLAPFLLGSMLGGGRGGGGGFSGGGGSFGGGGASGRW